MSPPFVFDGTAAQLDQVTISGLKRSQIIHVTDGDAATFSVDRTATDQIGYNTGAQGYVFFIPNAEGGRPVITTDPQGGIDVQLSSKVQPYDFNGDGTSDIAWVNIDGRVSAWSELGGGDTERFTKATTSATVPSGWSIIGSFDWNNDGFSDLVWQKSNGGVAVWAGQQLTYTPPTSPYHPPQYSPYKFAFDQHAYLDQNVDSSWKVVATNDLNGDGKGDLLWRNNDGSLSTWLSTGTGFDKNVYFHDPVSTGWTVEGSGDFNGDGRADILWRNSDGAVSTWNSNGSGFIENSFYQSPVDKTWHIVGIGDFNGDGRDDILWKNDNGAVSVWQGSSSGFSESHFDAHADAGWSVSQVGDFNGDGKSDILWRQDQGGLSIWTSTGSDWAQNNYSDGSVGNDWMIQGHQFPL